MKHGMNGHMYNTIAKTFMGKEQTKKKEFRELSYSNWKWVDECEYNAATVFVSATTDRHRYTDTDIIQSHELHTDIQRNRQRHTYREQGELFELYDMRWLIIIVQNVSHEKRNIGNMGVSGRE
jgi:hypothetical protein